MSMETSRKNALENKKVCVVIKQEKMKFFVVTHILLHYPSYIRGTKGVTKQNHNSPPPSYLKRGNTKKIG